MTIEAPLSKFKKTNLKIYIASCIVLAAFFAYDGYLSKYQWSCRRGFYEKHVKEGRLDDTMVWNQRLPFILGAVAIAFAVWLRTIKDKKLLADENELIISDEKRISYDSIKKIDKTNFSSKGFFIVTYENQSGNEISCKLSDKTYDNLSAVLDKLIAKIS